MAERSARRWRAGRSPSPTSRDLGTPGDHTYVVGRAVGQPQVPVFLYHAQDDDIVAFPQAVALMQDCCAPGVNVTWQQFPGRHIDGAFHRRQAIAFLDDGVTRTEIIRTC